MIDAYVWTTPNGYKALIALEELAVPYTPHWIDITKGEQKSPAFLAINPNHKIPALVDAEAGTTVFESGAIAIYLAEKTGKLPPASGRRATRRSHGCSSTSAGPARSWASSAISEVRQRKNSARDRAVHDRGRALVRRARQAFERIALSRR
jgi:glutathione S-transferase